MKLVTLLSVLLLLASSVVWAADLPGDKSDEPEWHFDMGGQVRATYPEAEPNDACTAPQQTACGDVVDPAQINPSGDDDWYSFYADAGTPLTLATDAAAGQPTMDTVIYLYANDCTTQLTSDDDGGPGLFSLINAFPAPYSGVYNLRVIKYTDSGTGYYKAMFNCTPPASGACCVGGGVCQILTATACATAGGTYMGDNTLCDPNPCPQPPPNDTCAGAYPLDRCSSGTIVGSMAAARNDYNPTSTGCTGYNENGPDLTWVFNLQVGDIVHVVYTTPSYDGAIYLVTDCANVAGSCVIGEDDPEPETWTYTVVNPGTYYLIVDAFTSSTSADFTLEWSVTCPPPPEPGACCGPDGLCTMVFETECVGIWYGGPCDPNPCPQPPEPGACCQPDGVCIMVLQAECLSPNVWHGGACDPNPCPPPVPTESTSWGRIKSSF